MTWLVLVLNLLFPWSRSSVSVWVLSQDEVTNPEAESLAQDDGSSGVDPWGRGIAPRILSKETEDGI